MVSARYAKFKNDAIMVGAAIVALMQYTLRPAHPEDARTIIEVHHSAIRSAAAAFYPEAVLDDWAPRSIPNQDVEKLAARIATGEEVVLLARTEADEIAGFGSIVPAQSELRAVYVAGDYGRRGIGRLILGGLEELAREAGVSELQMDASVNAEKFYISSGYVPVKRGNHTLRSGRQMACVHMLKRLHA